MARWVDALVCGCLVCDVVLLTLDVNGVDCRFSLVRDSGEYKANPPAGVSVEFPES